MLITDKKNRNFAFVSLDDIITSMEKCEKENIEVLKKLFNQENFEEKIRISKRSEAYKILKDTVIDGDYFVTPSMLSDAYTRASLEFNYEMKDRLFKYLKKYVDNLSENKENEKLIQKILCDEKVMTYLQKYESFEEYTKSIIGTRIKKYEEKKEEPKSKSFVRIAA